MLFDVATLGVLPKGDRSPKRFIQEPYSAISDDVIATSSALWEDELKGMMLLFTAKSEEFAGSLVESKLAAVIQKDVAIPLSTKVRYIADPDWRWARECANFGTQNAWFRAMRTLRAGCCTGKGAIRGSRWRFRNAMWRGHLS